MQTVEKEEEEEYNNYEENRRLYSNFIYSLKTEVSRKTYFKCLKYYMKFLGVHTLKDLIDKPQKIIESDIKEYLVYLRTKKKTSYKTTSLYLSAIRKFYYVNSDYQFKWDLITSYLGNDDDDTTNNDNNDDDNNNEDRPYTRAEIKQMFNAAQDIRVKIIVSLLSSSGLRHGVLPSLKLRDLEKIEKYNIYKITAYPNSKKFKYNTFCTPECSTLIDSYLYEYRKNKGEILKPLSPLIREQFNTKDNLKVINPKHLTLVTFRSLINDVLTKYTTLRKKLHFDRENNRKVGRNPTMLTHAFRKFFNTECAKAGVYPDFIELMLGHKLPGVRGHYMKPDINTLLEGTKEVKGYLAAIDSLTINDENRLSKQVLELEEKDDYQQFVIDKKLKEKDLEIEKMQQAMKMVLERLDTFNESIMESPKIKAVNSKIEEMKTEQLKQQSYIKIILEVEKKRRELFDTKGFVTKEDMILIENSYRDQLNQLIKKNNDNSDKQEEEK